MISRLDGLPEGVIGFEASGKIAAEDYRDVVLPALEQAAKAGEVRFVIVMRDFDGISGGAVWQDLKMGIEHLHAWKRIALVTDISWMNHLTNLFGWMTPGETKTFRLDQKDQAIEWVADQAESPRLAVRSGKPKRRLPDPRSTLKHERSTARVAPGQECVDPRSSASRPIGRQARAGTAIAAVRSRLPPGRRGISATLTAIVGVSGA